MSEHVELLTFAGGSIRPYYEPLRSIGLAFAFVAWAVLIEFEREQCRKHGIDSFSYGLREDSVQHAYARWYNLFAYPTGWIVDTSEVRR